MNFLEIGPAHTPEIEIRKNLLMSFLGFANKGSRYCNIEIYTFIDILYIQFDQIASFKPMQE